MTHAPRCTYCGHSIFPAGSRQALSGERTRTRDHIVPSMMGAEYLRTENIVPCCDDCNTVKGDAPVEVFLYFMRNYPQGKPRNTRQKALRQLCYNLARVGLKTCFEEAAAFSGRNYVAPPRIRGRHTKRDLLRGRA